MGRRWRAGPSIFDMMGRGPARPIYFSFGGPRPGPARQLLRGWAAARPSPSHFQKSPALPGPAHQIFLMCRPGPARPMTLAAKPMRHGLYTGWPAISVGRPVDLTGRATGRPMCCPVRQGEGICPYVFCCCTCTLNTNLISVFVFLFWIPWASP